MILRVFIARRMCSTPQDPQPKSVSTTSFFAIFGRNDGAQNLLNLNFYMGTIVDATEHRRTTARQRRSKRKRRRQRSRSRCYIINAGQARPTCRVATFGELVGVSRRRWCSSGSCCAASVACVASGLSGSGFYVFRCVHNHSRLYKS